MGVKYIQTGDSVDYVPGARSVVIGPARLDRRGRGDAPSLLEHGGSTTLARPEGRRRVTYLARPFMGPAFEKEISGLPALWRGSVK